MLNQFYIVPELFLYFYNCEADSILMLSFIKQTKNVLAIQSTLLYDYTNEVIISLLECMCCTILDNLFL